MTLMKISGTHISDQNLGTTNMTKGKTHNDYTLDEVANELTRLADLLAKGRILIGASEITVMDPTSFKTKLKLKNNHVSFEFSLALPIKKHEVARLSERKSPGSVREKKTETQHSGATSFPEGGKSLLKPKKDIARLWKILQHNLAARTPPPADQMTQLLSECNPAMYKGKPWHLSWTECCDLVARCIEAAVKGDYDTARQIAAEVDEHTHTCHKQYK